MRIKRLQTCFHVLYTNLKKRNFLGKFRDKTFAERQIDANIALWRKYVQSNYLPYPTLSNPNLA